MKTVSIIIPCYNEEPTLNILYNALVEMSDSLKNYKFEYLFVNDGSKDNTLNILKELAKKDDRVIYLSLSRNFGKDSAMYAGFCKMHCTVLSFQY